MAQSLHPRTSTKNVYTQQTQILTLVVLLSGIASILATHVNPPIATTIPSPKHPNYTEPVTKKPTEAPKTTEPQPQPKAPNYSYSEMFCQFGANSAASASVESQIKLILEKFDEKNDNRIIEDFGEADVDKNIALDISKVIKRFFAVNFCPIVAQVMSSLSTKEGEEVRSPVSEVTAISAYINRLEVSLEKAKATKYYEPRIVQLIQNLLSSLHDNVQKGLTELHSLEKGLTNSSLKPHAGNEFSYVRSRVLITLVEMFFDETVIRKSIGMKDSFASLSSDQCFEARFDMNHEIEVACAFRFLFNSSVQLKELITANFALDEQFTRQSAQQMGLPPVPQQSCSNPRTDSHEKQEVAESSCYLKDLIEQHHECSNIAVNPAHPHPSPIDCLKIHIEAKFPENYHNKLLMALNGAGPDGLVFVLKSFCLDKSAFVAFSTIDVGLFYQNVVKLTQIIPDQETQLPPVTDIERKQYIIESIIMYFLRGAEQRMSCSIKPVV